MNKWHPETIRDVMISAGRIALTHFETPETEHKADRSLVTVADTAIETYLRQTLMEDGVSFIGEESALAMPQGEIDGALRGTTWVVDPIDGTAPYANRLPTWGVSLALMEGGRITEGALFLPRTGELFISSGEDVLYQGSTRDPQLWAFEEMIPFRRPGVGYTTTGMVSLPQEMRRSGRFLGGNPFQCNGSAVYSIAKTITGSYLGYIARIRLWDLAGAIPILRRLGFQIVFRDGHSLGDAVTAQDWILTAGSADLWKCRELLYIAGNDETTRPLIENYREGE